jgi:hypothetical protein
LLETQSILTDEIRQRDEILNGIRFPLVSEKDRRQSLASLEQDITAKTEVVDDLVVVVGDPESVADAKVWAPRRSLASQPGTERAQSWP